MKTPELERMLTDPEGLKILSERARSIRDRYGSAEGVDDRPAARQRAVEPRSHELRPTPEEIRANDDDHIARGVASTEPARFLPSEIAGLSPPLEGVSPAEILQEASRRCREDPSPANRLFVEDVLNHLTTIGELDSRAEKAVQQAIDLLAEAGAEADSIGSRFYQHANYHGWSFYVDHAPGWVYRLLTSVGSSYNDAISSLYVTVSAGDRGEAILFEHGRFVGRYARFPGTPGTTAWTGYVGGFINDRTSSILAVRRFSPEREVPIALGSLGLRGQVEEYMAGIDRISLRGAPVITWDMWPEFSPSRRYIYLRIPVRVDVPYWFDYDAEIRYWIYLYVDGAGGLHGYTDWYGCWVEGGVKSGSIADRIMSELPSTLGAIDTRLAGAFSLVTPLVGPLERQYFLPGKVGATGHTDDDVTVVLVKRHG